MPYLWSRILLMTPIIIFIYPSFNVRWFRIKSYDAICMKKNTTYGGNHYPHTSRLFYERWFRIKSYDAIFMKQNTTYDANNYPHISKLQCSLVPYQVVWCHMYETGLVIHLSFFERGFFMKWNDAIYMIKNTTYDDNPYAHTSLGLKLIWTLNMYQVVDAIFKIQDTTYDVNIC